MRIKRVTASFQMASGQGMAEGELVPENHPLVKVLPKHFEDADEYVSRLYPELCETASRPTTKKSSASRSKGQVSRP